LDGLQFCTKQVMTERSNDGNLTRSSEISLEFKEIYGQIELS